MSPICRSALFIPAANARAMAKAPTLAADMIILDLEDAVAPQQKEKARAGALAALRQTSWQSPCRAVRINGLDTPWGAGDVRALGTENIDALIIPKVQSADDVKRVHDRLIGAGAKTMPALWAMIETPAGVLALGDITTNAQPCGLRGLIAGTNDLALGLHCDGLANNRQALIGHLSQIVLHARAAGLMALDGVYNAFDDAAGFAAQVKQGRQLGFDGKTLIHPAQIETAARAFGPTNDEIKRARAIVRAFGLKKNAGLGAISLGGEMIERLHLHEAQNLLASLPKSATAKEKGKSHA